MALGVLHILLTHRNGMEPVPICFVIIEKHSETRHIQSLVGCFVDFVTITRLLSIYIIPGAVHHVKLFAASAFFVMKLHDQSDAACHFMN